MRTMTTLVLTAALTSLAGAASAEDLKTISVPFAQADLQSPEAVAGLYGRIEDAAEELCRIENRAPMTTYASCLREVVSAAVADAEIAPLSEYAAALESGNAGAVEIASR